MLGKKCKCCLFSWLSGFFTLAVIGHTMRILMGASIQVNGTKMPMAMSVGIAVCAGVLAIAFCIKSRRACGCNTEKSCSS